jgi:hypothetical protein
MLRGATGWGNHCTCRSSFTKSNNQPATALLVHTTPLPTITTESWLDPHCARRFYRALSLLACDRMNYSCSATQFTLGAVPHCVSLAERQKWWIRLTKKCGVSMVKKSSLRTGGGERRPSGLPGGHVACMPPSTKEEQRGDVIISLSHII